MVKLRVRDLYDGMLLKFVGNYSTEYFDPGEVVVVSRDPDAAHRASFTARSNKLGIDYFLWSDNLYRFKVEEGPW